MSETLEHLKRLEHEIECYKQIIKELSGYDVVGVGIDKKTYDPLFNAYEAYENRFKVSQSPRKTTIYLTEGDVRYIYDKLGYKGVISVEHFQFARAVEKEVLRRNT